MTNWKRCSKCGIGKNRSDFGNRRSSPDGKRGMCKVCVAESRRRYYDKNADKERKRARDWNRNNPDKHRESKRRWAKENPEKVRASRNRSILRNPQKVLSRILVRAASNVVDPGKKLCKKCNAVKLLDGFSKNSASKDGKQDWCKACQSKAAAEWNKRNPVRRRELNREWYHKKRDSPDGVARESASSYRRRKALYTVRNPQKIQARAMVVWGVEVGEIAKPCDCERCGSGGTLEAHHWNYGQEHWLDVEWLCPQCHGLVHRKDYDPFTDEMRKPEYRRHIIDPTIDDDKFNPKP